MRGCAGLWLTIRGVRWRTSKCRNIHQCRSRDHGCESDPSCVAPNQHTKNSAVTSSQHNSWRAIADPTNTTGTQACEQQSNDLKLKMEGKTQGHADKRLQHRHSTEYSSVTEAPYDSSGSDKRRIENTTTARVRVVHVLQAHLRFTRSLALFSVCLTWTIILATVAVRATLAGFAFKPCCRSTAC